MGDPNRETVRRLIRGMDDGDFGVFDEVCAPGYLCHFAGAEAPQTRDEHREAARSFYVAFPDLRHEIHDLVAEGDRVVLRATAIGTHEGPFLGVEPTGAEVGLEVMATFRIVDGQIEEEWIVADLLGLQGRLRAAAAGAEGEALMQLSRDWSDLVATGNLDAILAGWADDAVMMPPGTPPLEGKPAIREYVETALGIPGFEIRWEPIAVHVAGGGDMAWMIERNATTVHDADGNPITTHGKVVTVWRRDADGSWKNVVDMWNEAPAPEGGQAVEGA